MGLFRRKRKANAESKETYLVDDQAPFAFVEAFKSLRTNVDYLAQTENYRTIMVTSAEPGDGKSTVSVNLAITLADSGKSVILVDCDLRKGTVGRYLGINRNEPGVTSVISGRSNLSQTIIGIDDFGIDVLTVGPVPTNPSEVIGSQGMINLINALAKAYDYVILDTPPVTVVTDAAIMSRYADGVLLVVKHNHTTKQALRSSLKKLDDVNANVLGAVMNSYDLKSSSYGGDYYSYYSYGYGENTGKKKRRR